MANSNYYLGRSPEDTLGDSPRYWYALRRNEDGELFINGWASVMNIEKLTDLILAED